MAEVQAKPEEQIARYIYSAKCYSSNGVKHNTFVPPKSHPNELSVCIIADLAEEEIWKLGAETRKDKPVRARANLMIAEVHEVSDEQDGYLQVLIDGIPHPRHANIKNIPLQKSLQRTVATELANKSQLRIAV